MTAITTDQANCRMDRAVADCFGALLEAMRASADNLRWSAAEALMDRDDARANERMPALELIAQATKRNRQRRGIDEFYNDADRPGQDG